MNELQLSLLVIGAGVVFAVLAFNRWQELKYRRQAEQRFPSQHDDILLKEEAAQTRVEPVLDAMPESEIELPDDPEPVQEEQAAWNPPEEPGDEEVMEAPLQSQQMDVVQPTSAEPAPLALHEAAPAPDAPDDLIEYVAMLDASDPVSAHALILILQQMKPVGKPLRWLGRRHLHSPWEDIAQATPDTEYVTLAACMQLADRNGPAQTGEIDAFCDMTQAVAANLYTVINCADRMAARDLAAELDQFCADVDVVIGVNVISRDGAPFAGTKLRGLAESAGMKLMPDGYFHYLNDQGMALFSLGNLEAVPFTADAMKHLATHGVTFLFDVPKAAGGVQSFNQMLLAARQFTAPLGALMVDDNRNPLTDTGLDKIRQQLTAIYDEMERHGISPGSPRSRRLFS